MSDTQFAYYKTTYAKKRDRRSLVGPFLQWTSPGRFGVPFALFRTRNGILIVSPDLLPPETLAALPLAPGSEARAEDAAIIGHLRIVREEETSHE